MTDERHVKLELGEDGMVTKVGEMEAGDDVVDKLKARNAQLHRELQAAENFVVSGAEKLNARIAELEGENARLKKLLPYKDLVVFDLLRRSHDELLLERDQLREEHAHLKQIKGVACLEGHDLCHSFACGRCFDKFRASRDKLREEIEHNISQLKQFAITENGKGQLAAWLHIRSVFTGNWGDDVLKQEG